MQTNEGISESESAYMPKAITMETEVTENGTIHQEKVNVTAEGKYSGLNDIKQILNTCRLTAEPTIAKNIKETSERNHNDNTNDINQELQGEFFKREKDVDHALQVSLEFETVPSSYEMPDVIYAIIHKDHSKDSSTTALGEAAPNSVAVEDLEVADLGIASKPLSVTAAAAIVAEVNQEEMVETFQTTDEVEKETAAVTKPRKESATNPSVVNLNEGILETSLEISQNEENVENFSLIDLNKLTIESSTLEAIPQDDKGMISLLATSLNGEIKPYLASNDNQTSNDSVMYQDESEITLSAIQNESLAITTPVQYADELESAHRDKFKLIKKYSNTNHDRDLIQENRSAECLTSLSKKIVLEIMELQRKSLKDNLNQKVEVQSESRNTKPQSAKPTQGEENKIEASGNENVVTEHVDFATARRQWLMLEEISRTQDHRPPVKQQKNKTVTKRIIKEKKDDPSVTKLIKRETTCPHSASLTFSEDKLQSSTPVGIKIDEVEYWRSSTNLTQKDGTLASHENNGTLVDLDPNLVLNIADFSPCSEGSDSGLDSTCRSEGNNLTDTVFQNETSSSVPVTHGKSETPIEREIRLGVKREESLRKARGIIKLAGSEEYVEIKTRPLILQPVSSSSSKVKNNQFAEMQMQREILLERQREEDLVQQGKVKGTYDESITPEIEERRKFFEQQYPFSPPLPSKMLFPHINIPASLSATPSVMKKYPSYNEMQVANVVVLENNVLTSSDEDKTGVTAALTKLKYPNVETVNVVILETPNLIIQSSSDFTLPSIPSTETEDALQNNPFFKLRSHGSQSILSQEIREVLQREEELRKQRCHLHDMATSPESSFSSSTKADNLSPGHKSNENTSQDCPDTALRG